MVRWTTVWLVAWAVLAAFIQPGFFINDEYGQAASLYSKAAGHVGVTGDLPLAYQELADGFPGVSRSVIPAPGDEVTDSGSPTVSILALPALAVLRALSAALGPQFSLGLLVAGITSAGMAAAGRTWGGGRRWASHGPWLLGLATVGLAPFGPVPPASPYLEVAAIMVTDTLVAAFSAALMYDLLRPRFGTRPALALSGLYLLGTPALFWSLNLKYHGLVMALVVMAIWCYQAGHRSGATRTFLAFSVAGLAVWAHPPNGLLLLASMGVMALPAILLGWRGLLVRAAAGAAGLGLGLLPDLLERRALASIGRQDRHIQLGGESGGAAGAGGSEAPGSAVDAVRDEAVRQSDGGYLQWAAWNDSAGALEATWQAMTWIPRDTPDVGHALPILAVAPFLAAVLLLAVPRLRRRLGQVLPAWILVHGVLLFVLFGAAVFRNGAGFDLRQASTWWPFLVIGAAPGLSWAWREAGRWRRPAFVAGALVYPVILGAPMLVLRHLYPDVSLAAWRVYEIEWPFRVLGTALAIAAVALIAAAWRRPDRFRRAAAATLLVGAAFAVEWQIILQFGPARGAPPEIPSPAFAAGWMRPLEAAIEWFLYSW